MMQIRLDGFCLPDVMICMFSAPIPSHFSISPAHVCRSEEGQMTSSGHSDEKYMATANAWMVLPSPISATKTRKPEARGDRG